MNRVLGASESFPTPHPIQLHVRICGQLCDDARYRGAHPHDRGKEWGKDGDKGLPSSSMPSLPHD